ncbi:MAG: chromosomal replication initiator protein DnaA [Clostridia bacterium]|nr:chromosomal replication initiator protein DnaA [Clostridia bacterium]
MQILKDYWQRVLEIIQPEMVGISFDTWVKPLTPISMDDSTIYLKASSQFQKNTVDIKYKELIKIGFKHVTNKDYSINIVLDNVQEVEPKEQKISVSNNPLNPKYTFDTFVIGENNRFAHAAALAAAESLGKAYNPLFLYGGVGLGKTHLMHAIGNFVLTQNSDAKVLYITSEKFTNELINAIQNNTTEDFRNKYRNIDLLLIDDIQFFIGKERCQEEFFHTFNALHENGKQMVISSDKPPKDIHPLEERLKSRFEWGLVADIGKPDFETRCAILRKKCQVENRIMDDEILSMIALKVESNIRELEGVFNKIVAMASLTNSEITMSLAERAIGDLQRSADKVITIDYVQYAVANYFNLDQNDFKIQRKTSDIAFPRQIAMYLCKQLTGLSLKEIGKEFGGKDHSTVIYAIKKVEEEIKLNPNTNTIVDNIKKMIVSKSVANP